MHGALGAAQNCRPHPRTPPNLDAHSQGLPSAPTLAVPMEALARTRTGGNILAAAAVAVRAFSVEEENAYDVAETRITN